MKKREYSSLGLAIALSVPSSVDEFNTLAKATDPQANPCLDEATNNVVYRGSLAEFRELFLHGRKADAEKGLSEIIGVEGVSNIDRRTIPVMKDGKAVEKDGQPVETFDPEDSEAKYFKRVCAEMKVEPSHFATLAQQVADTIAFDPSASERKPSLPKKLPKDILEKATAKVAQGEEAFNKLAGIIAKNLSKERIVWTGDAAKDSETLGWEIKADLAHAAKMKLEKY